MRLLVVDPLDWCFHFTPLARLTEGVPFAREPFERLQEPVFAPPPVSEDRWVGEWIDPWSGATLGEVDVQAEGPRGTLELEVPSFSRDVALRLDRVGE